MGPTDKSDQKSHLELQDGRVIKWIKFWLIEDIERLGSERLASTTLDRQRVGCAHRSENGLSGEQLSRLVLVVAPALTYYCFLCRLMMMISNS